MNNPFDQFDAVADQPRGVRNNNPLNLTGHWDGQIGSDGPFAQFASVDDGRAAADRNLQAYASKHGINTVAGVVSRWAPPSENDTHAYVSKVSDALGVDPNAPLDMSDPQLRTKLLGAMESHETGQAPAANPFDQFDGAAEPAPRQGPAAALPQPAATGAPAVINADTGKPYNDAQQAAYAQLIQAGKLDPNATPGSQAFPRGLSSANDQPKPGDWYVDLDGSVKQASGGSPSVMDDAKSGFMAPIDKLTSDFRQAYDRPAPTSFAQANQQAAGRLTDLPRLGGDVAGLLGAPLQALIRPAARGLNRINPLDAYTPDTLSFAGGPHIVGGRKMTADEEQANTEGALNTALSAVRGVDAPAAAPRLKPMSVPELADAKNAAYAKVDASGYRFPNADVKALADTVQTQIRDLGGPKAAKLLSDSDAMHARLDALAKQKGGVPLTQLEKLRGDVYKVLVEPGGPDSVIGSAIRQGIDGLIDASGNPDVAQARAANAQYMKAKEVTDRLDSADLRASSTYAGGNKANATRQSLRPLIDPKSPQRIRNLTPDETSALNRVVRGSPAANAARVTGKLLDPRGLIGASIQGAIALPTHGVGNVLSAAPGMAASSASNALTMKSVQDLLDLISTGGVKPVRPLPTAAAPGSTPILSARGLVGDASTLSPLARLPQAKREDETSKRKHAVRAR
jgi:hypothetical protein